MVKSGDGCLRGSLDRYDVFRLRTLLTLGYRKLDLLTFIEGAVALAGIGDGTEVDEQIGTVLTLDKTVSLGIVEPLHGSRLTL